MEQVATKYIKSDGKKWHTGGGRSSAVVMLDALDFPAGTEIVTVEPTCPECGQPRGLCEAGECVFCWYGVKGRDGR